MENTKINYEKLNSWRKLLDNSLYGWSIWEPTDIHSQTIHDEHKVARRVRHFTIINESIKKHRFNPDTTKVYYARKFDEICGSFLRNKTSRLMLLELVNEEMLNGLMSIRSVRGFYIPEQGRWFEFDETNTPIYEAVKPYLTFQNQKIEFLDHLNDQIKDSGILLSENESSKLNFKINKIIDANFEVTVKQFPEWEKFIHHYFKVFFDNVKGRHGHFWICESLEEALNALWLATYVEGKDEFEFSENGTYKGINQAENGEIKFIIKKKEGREGENDSQPDEVESMAMKLLTLSFSDENSEAKSFAYLIFKDSLFSTFITLKDEGLVKLEGEKLIIEGINPYELGHDFQNLTRT